MDYWYFIRFFAAQFIIAGLAWVVMRAWRLL